ncbi:MAG: DUF308 domain-containing protein [Oscillospiraceae bacterium]|nr:DUF308 domain-containing protein [Oscillospiraceae bacterium]
MQKNSSLMTAVLTIALGIVFVIKRGGVLGLAVSLVGIVLIIAAIFDLVKKDTTAAIIKGVIGIGVLVFGNLFIHLALYLIAIMLLMMGLLQLVQAIRNKNRNTIAWITPVLSVLAGICLLFQQGSSVDWIFVMVGIVLIIEGILSLGSRKA